MITQNVPLHNLIIAKTLVFNIIHRKNKHIWEDVVQARWLTQPLQMCFFRSW